jgi:energy-coupling factor transporter ATP-binding protein EcfA2
MRLTEFRVRNYRTIGAEQTLKLPSGTTLVGPNNSGKTNLLRSVQLFFTGYENSVGYRRATDLTFGAGTQQTSLLATFEKDDHPKDDEILGLLDDLHQIVGTTRDSDSFSVNLYFTSPNDTPVYRVFGNTKVQNAADRPAYSRKQKQLVELLTRSFRCHYVPSAKSIRGLYDDLLHPFLQETAYQAILPHLAGVETALKQVSESLNNELRAVGLGDIEATFSLGGNSSSQILTGFDLMISDPGLTPLAEKGQGIQSTALFASFVWITEQEKAAGYVPVWLIEEPESYLHPELNKACRELLDNLSTKSLVMLSTHSLAFVPTDVSRVQGVDLDGVGGNTTVSTFASHHDATLRIRQSLGVQFSDYYNLSQCNLFVEGPSDTELITWARERLAVPGADFPNLRSALVEDFGGVSQLEGFLKAVFDPIRRERAVVAVFDGDAAGQKARQALQQYFGQKQIQFQHNRDFVSVRTGFAIEGLFPDDWIIELNATHPSWFETFSVDSQGALEPFRIASNHKPGVAGAMKGRADVEDTAIWGGRWIAFLTAIEEALTNQLAHLPYVTPSTTRSVTNP